MLEAIDRPPAANDNADQLAMTQLDLAAIADLLDRISEELWARDVQTLPAVKLRMRVSPLLLDARRLAAQARLR